MRYICLLLLLACGVWHVQAQPANDDCASAQTLCAGQPLPGDNTGSTGGPGFCPNTDALVWYSFTSNSVGGAATFSITGLDCPVVTGMDNEVSMVVLSGDGSCLPASFTSVSPCDFDSVDFSVTAPNLLPNTMYWVVIGGLQNGGATINAQCSFDLTMSGPGVNIVGVDFDAGMDLLIGEGEVVQLTATGGTTYDWTPTAGLSGNNIPDPFAQPAQTTTYTVTTDLNGCTYTDTVVVEVVRLIDPPNTITPNGDGINDTWEIYGIQDYPNAEVIIYDRWGQKVYRSNGYKEEWDGTNNGKELSTATYYYYIELNKLEGKAPPYTGSITIIR